MRVFLFSIILIFGEKIIAQGTAGFFDDRNFFYTYMNGGISKQEILPVRSIYPSLNYVSYIDVNGNFKLIVNHIKYTIYSVPPDNLKVSNYLMAYTQGLQLGVFNGKQSKKVETFTRSAFKLGDSVLAYLDNYDRLKVYVYDTIYNLMDFSDTARFHISDNMVVFYTLDNRFKVFYNESIFDLEGFIPNDYKMGRGLIAYHDFIDNFVVFDRGEKIVLENYRIENYQVSNEFLTYLTNVNEWKAYYQGRTYSLLSTAPRIYNQKRNILAYSDNANNFFIFYKGKSMQLENYTPTKFEIWDDILVYEDIYRVLWGVYKGEKIQISKGVVQGDWFLQNQCVEYWDLTPNTKTIWNKRNLYQYSESDDPNRR